MYTRILPKRSTRGQLPPHLKQQSPPTPLRSKKPKKEREQDVQRREMQLTRRTQQLINLTTYPFHRVVHYFFNLSTFPRVKGHPSYVENINKLFHLTYSQDANSINGARIGELLNRKYFGLPYRSPTLPPMPKVNTCKNICYGYLSAIQDKKYNYDRVIYSLKLFLKNIEKMNLRDFLKFDFIKKDNDLQILLQEDLNYEEKRKIIQEKLIILEYRKTTNSKNWQADETVYFYHALNQQLHDKINKLKKYFTNQSFSDLISSKTNANQESQLKSNQQLTFYLSGKSYLSKKSELKIMKDNIKNINFPFVVLAFTKNKTVKILSSLILGLRSVSLSQAHFYEVKNIFKKLLQLQMEVKPEKIYTFDQYLKIFKGILEKIRKIRQGLKGQEQVQAYNSPLLDNYLNANLNKKEQFNLLRLGESFEVSNREYVLIMIYFWLTRVIQSLLPYLSQIPELIEMISLDYYPKVHNSLVEAIGTPLSGILIHLLETIPEILTKPDPLNNVAFRLTLEFNDKLGVVILYKSQNLYELNPSPTRSFIGDMEDISLGSKKVKRM